MTDTLNDNVAALPQMGTFESKDDSRWKALRAYARRQRDARKQQREWEVTTDDYRLKIAYPDIPLDTRAPDTAVYVANGENPLNSDTYAALGNCAVRAYLAATLRKKDNDHKIYVCPHRVGVRIWDDYNFKDEMLDFLQGLFVDGKPSQFLGSWINEADGTLIVLHNSDFDEYRDWFKPIYNQFLEQNHCGKEKRLACTDFHPVSTWIEQNIESTTEYPLLGLDL